MYSSFFQPAFSGLAQDPRLQDAVHAIEASPDTPAALGVVLDYAANFGLEMAGMANTASTDYLHTRAVYRQEWPEHYVRCGYAEIDPVIATAQRRVAPVSWHVSRPAPWFSPRQHQIYREVTDFGIKGGLCLPFHEPDCSSYVGFFHALDDPARLPYSVQASLHFVGLHLHEHAVRNLRERAGVNTSSVQLTPRERDCLRWIKEGLTVPQVARRLAISERTVAFHLQNCRDKLDANTIAHAVARAMILRLIF